MTLLNKNSVLNSQDLDFEDVEIPEWDGTVRISVMSSSERDKFESSVVGKSGGINHNNLRAKLAAYCLIDEDGNKLFTEQDVQKLGQKSAKALDRIFAVAQRINGIGNEEVEALAKN